VALKAYSLREKPELEPDFDRLAEVGWPRFLRQRDERGCGQFWPSLFTTWVDVQTAFYDDAGHVAAVAHAVPFAWDGTPGGLPDSIAGVLEHAERDRKDGRAPTALAALAALVDPAWRGQGLSRRVVQHLRHLAEVHRLGALVAPVRPTLKARYPLTPMERYVRWTTDGGEPFDPWMRVHARLGAAIVGVVPRALVIAGPVAAWEEWTDMRFPETGPYVVPGALQPVAVDRERDEARYEDPNVWMHHPIGGAR
jgi:GNAT superfamily N-acetyltransferase